MYREFEEYVSQYDLKDVGIAHKFFHSKRVAIINADLASHLNLSYQEVLLARQIGLLHDIGRFYEWQSYQTYKGENFDHAQYGVKILKKNNYINNFNINEKDKDLLYKAIYYHNKYSVSKKYCNKYQIKMIRDADKIDIFYYLGSKKDLNKYQDSMKINVKVLNHFNNHKLVHNTDIQTTSDRVLANLALIYDINFTWSLWLIKENKYIEKYYNYIENREYFKVYFDLVNKYMEKRLEHVRF